MYKSVFIYNYGMHRWHNYRYVSMCSIGVVNYWLPLYCLWCASMQILYNYRYICVPVQYTITSLYPPSFKIARCGFCLTTFSLSDDPASLFTLVNDMSLCLLPFICVIYCTAIVMYWQFHLKSWQVVECVDVNLFTWLMLLCSNNNSPWFPTYPSWSCHGKSFLIIFLLFSDASFILLSFCLLVSPCSMFICLGGWIMHIFTIMSFLSVSISLHSSCLCSWAKQPTSSIYLPSVFWYLFSDVIFCWCGGGFHMSLSLLLCIQSCSLITYSFSHCGFQFHAQICFHASTVHHLAPSMLLLIL